MSHTTNNKDGTVQRDEHGAVSQEWRGQEQVAAHLRERWSGILNMNWDFGAVRADVERELKVVREDRTCQLPERLRFR